MEIVKVRPRGQITIPKRLREELRLDEYSVLTAYAMGEALVLVPGPTLRDQVAAELEAEMAKRGITLDDVLEDLRRERRRYMEERYGLRGD